MKRIKTSIIVTLTFFAAFLMLQVGAVKASAATQTAKLESKTAYAFVQRSHTNIAPIKLNNAKLVSVKSSNPNVAKVSANNNGKYVSCYTPKKGTATITYTLKENGKKYQLKQKIVVTDSYPFEKLTVNNKSLLKNLDNVHQMSVLKNKKNFTIKWKLKKGWKVKRAYNEASGEDVKSGSTKVNLKDRSFSAVSFNFIDKKSNTYMNYIIPLWAKS